MTGVANMAFRSMGMHQLKAPARVRKYELTVNPEAYQAQALKVLSAANQMLISAAGEATGVNAPKAEPVTEPAASEASVIAQPESVEEASATSESEDAQAEDSAESADEAAPDEESIETE